MIECLNCGSFRQQCNITTTIERESSRAGIIYHYPLGVHKHRAFDITTSPTFQHQKSIYPYFKHRMKWGLLHDELLVRRGTLCGLLFKV